jgi:outer membrane protein OmpA-like peptidoglycan-associated protein/tetratricopeptide (TPR) repeat protein
MESRQYCIAVLLTIVLCCPLRAQDIKALLDKGDKFFGRKDYESALNIYQEAYKLDPNDAGVNFRVGVCYLHGETKAKALSYLEKANLVNPAVDEDMEYHLGMAYQNNHQYAKAKEFFIAFKRKNKKLTEIADHKIDECEIGDSLTRKPAHVVIENVGGVVNTNFHEYSPLFSDDGNTLIFTSNRSSDETKIKMSTNYEDIYITHRTETGWAMPHKISENINIKYNDAAASLSADGKTLFLYYEEGAGDIYTSRLENGVWSKPEPLNRNINTPLFWETSASISADGKKLFFTSNRPGGQGELDIYISERDANGNWGKAVNLGPTINTPFHEDSPFIHQDGVTLFFSSDGHPTMGSNDIFKSEYTGGKWTKPVNLGYPINSIEYDGFFMLSADKKTGYYSALREDGLGSADIYQIKFLDPPKEEPISAEPVVTASLEPQLVTPEPAQLVVPQQPVPEAVPQADTITQGKTEDFVDPIIQLHKDMKIVTILKGKVIDETSAAPLSAVITLVDNTNQHIIAKINSNPQTGDFELVIPHGGNYGVATERAGYLFNSINFNVPQFAEYQEIDTHILMVKAEVGSKMVLKNIFFDVGKSDLKAESLAELEKIKELLSSDSQLKVQINGHTDNTGNASGNMSLSLKRSQAVVQYLIEQGIDMSRLQAKGFGSERPLVSNDDEQEGRAINRRTEIEIIEAGGQG